MRMSAGHNTPRMEKQFENLMENAMDTSLRPSLCGHAVAGAHHAPSLDNVSLGLETPKP